MKITDRHKMGGRGAGRPTDHARCCTIWGWDEIFLGKTVKLLTVVQHRAHAPDPGGAPVP